MKITIVQGAFLPIPPLIGGAVEKIWFALGKEFARRGHEVVHISRSYKGLPPEEVIDGVRHIRVPGFDQPSSLALLKFRDLIYSLRAKKILPHADVLVTNTFWLPMLVRSPRYGKLYVQAQRYPKWQYRLYRNASRIQAVSTSVANEIIRQEPGIREKVRVIPNLVKIPLTIGEIERLAPARKKTILYVGRIHPEKGLGLLIDAFKQVIEAGFKDWKLVLVGPWQVEKGGGGGRYLSRLQSKAEQIKQYVDWAGPVFSDKGLGNYYKEASLFVYPSLADKGEAFALATLEAMSYGCPPLVSGLECFKDFIEDGKTGFIFNHRAPDPVTALSQKIEESINSKELLSETGKNSYNKSREYSLERVADMYLADFEALL